MRRLVLGLIAILVGCTHHTVAPASPESRVGTARMVYVDSATLDSIKRAHPPSPQAIAVAGRFDSLAALVDTIVILSPDSIVLHVGEARDHWSLIRKEARRASGEVVPSYPGLLDIEDRSIATFTDAGITGVRPGRTRVVVTVINKHAHAPPSYIPVVVIP